MGNQYTSSRYGTRQLMTSFMNANVVAAHAVAVVRFFSTVLVREVSIGNISTATSHATHAIKVYKNTTSIGQVLIGTGIEGAIVDASLTDTTFASTDYLALKTTNSNATFNGNWIIDYNELYAEAD